MTNIKYYLSRVVEARKDFPNLKEFIIIILNLIIIRFKKFSYALYYNKHLYSYISKFFISKDKIKITDYNSDIFIENILKYKQEIESDENYRILLNNIKNNQFQCLGYGIGTIPRGDDWNKDQFHNYSWEKIYFNNIDFTKINVKCDVKIPWEYSRLQFLIPISIDFILNKTDSSLQQYDELVNDWIESNPTGYGVNWIVNMEVSIRFVNLILSYLIMNKFISENLNKKIVRSIYEHQHYIKTFPELSDIPGNHYLSNLMGLYLSNFFIYGQDHEETIISLNYFTNESKKQFLDGGCHFEMSTIYSRLCLDFISIVLIINQNKKSKDNSDLKVLRNLFFDGVDFLEKISSNYSISMFGDFDSGHLIWLGDDFRCCKNLVNIRKMLQNKGFETNPYIILFQALSNSKRKKSNENVFVDDYCIEKSGFILAKKGGLTSSMRVGPQGLKGRASHDHDDALSIWLAYDGTDILIDSGCAPYTLDIKERTNSIISSSHNVLVIKKLERNSSTQGSIVKTVKGANTCNHYVINNNKNKLSFTASLNSKKSKIIYNSRKVILENNSCLINDNWEIDEKMKTRLKLRFNTDIKPKFLGKNKFLISIKNIDLELELFSDLNMNFNIFKFDFYNIYGSSIILFGVDISFEKSFKGSCSAKICLHNA